MDLLPVAPLDELRQRRSEKWLRFPPDVLPLFVAEMDFALAPPVTAVLHDAIDRGDTGYPVSHPVLGEALAGFAADRWGWRIDPASVTAVADVGIGVVEVLRALCRPGDDVVFCPPVYPPFYDWVPEAGAHIVEVPLDRQTAGWRLDLPALERAFASGPVAFVLCNPHNPVGRAHTPDELAEVVRLATAYGVTVVSDEIHGPLALPGAAYTPMLTVPGAADVTVNVVSASKAWNLAGLKCASVVTASPSMAAVVDRFPAETAARVGHLGVLASVAAYTEGVPWLDQLLATLDDRRTLLGQLLRERLPMLTWQPPEATYLAWLDCTALGGGDRARELFLDKGRVALERGGRFGAAGSDFVRFNFATSPEILDAATTQMAAAVP